MLKKSLYVTLITVFTCWIVLDAVHQTTQAYPSMAKPYPTFSCSASAGKMGCSSSATPGIGNHNNGQPGNGWTGTGSANAGVGGGSPTGPTDQRIEAYIYNSQVTVGVNVGVGSGSGSIGIGINYGSNFNEVKVKDASESRWGTPFQDKWASSSGCFAEIPGASYNDYDGWL